MEMKLLLPLLMQYYYDSENISVSVIVFHGVSYLLFLLLEIAIFVYYLSFFFYGMKTTLYLRDR